MWRDQLRPASFRGVRFYIEIGSRAGGRRIALHEYSKRDQPYAEDMGRRARKFQITGYLIGPDYLIDRDSLIEALELESPGRLVHPTLGEFEVVNDEFGAVERRERGGYVEMDMRFLEAGSAAAFSVVEATDETVREKASALGDAAVATEPKAGSETISV